MSEMIRSYIRWKITLLLIICFCSLETDAKYGGGSGTTEDPYQIWTAEQMNEIGLNPEDWNKHFRLMADIDLSAYTGTQFNTIGRDMPFEGAFDICLDTNTDTMYWTNYEEGRIQWASTHPIDYQDFVVIEPNRPLCIAIDHVNNKIYWTSDKIQRANLDGTEIEDVITTDVHNAYGIAVDGVNGKIYWAENSLHIIRRADIDGNNVEDFLVNNIEYPSVVMLDIDNGYIYWNTGTSIGGLYRARLDGTEPTQVTYGIVRSLALDKINRKLYWTDSYSIKRANLDGTEVENILSPGYGAAGITLDTINNKIYWTHSSGGVSIRRANFDGSEIDILIPPQAFRGVFDGNGNSIYNFQYICQDRDKVGMFEYVRSPAEIKNLQLINPVVDVNGGRYIGSLVGFLRSGTVSNCIIENANVSGESEVGGLAGLDFADVQNCHVSGIVNGNSSVGGIAGSCDSSNEMSSCSFEGTVTGSYMVGGLCGTYIGYLSESYVYCNVNGNDQIGGLVGRLYGGEILACFSSGNVNGQTKVGGLAGRNRGRLISSYSSADVFGASEIGGLAGANESSITACFAFGAVDDVNNSGGLVGFGDPLDVENSFWDVNTVGLITSAGGIGLPTVQMKDASTYSAAWSCQETLWTIADGNDYPRLLWENRPGELIERYTYGGGSGTTTDPYLIYTAEQLNLIGLLECDWSNSFKLMADINMSDLNDASFNMIGYYDYVYSNSQYNPFDGIFDGNGHTVYNLTIDADEDDYVGMFGYLGVDGVVKNLCLENATLDINDCTYSAALLGRNAGLLYACCCDADIINGGNSIGGLVGYNIGNGSIVNCYTTGYVEGQNSISGLVGRNLGLIRRCYSAAQITGSQYTGGLVGYNESQAMIDSCFWDVDVSGEPNGVGSGADGDVTGKTTPEMQNSHTFLDAGWDFIGENTNGPSDVWAEIPGNNYMVLWWQLDPNDLSPLATFSGGTGTPQEPYLISTASDIGSIGHNPRLMDSHFLLVNDINLAGTDFHSIGNQAYAFQGSFDGNGFEVSNLNMEQVWKQHFGFFEYTDNNCVIKNLGLVDVNINTEKCLYVGGLAGLCNNTEIINCYLSGAITAHDIGYGNRGLGGLLGRSVSSTLQGCFSEGTFVVTGYSSYVGGLVNSFYDSHAENCFSTASVTSYEQSGGLFSYCGSSRVENCYAAGPVEATHYNGDEGGLVGYYYDSEYKNCFWDINTTGQSNATGNSTVVIAIGKTTAEMLTASTFTNAGWDFLNTWDILEGVCYPYIKALPGPKPFKAHSFVPENGSDYINICVEICFESGVGATSHNIYFGTINPPPFIRNQTELSYSPGLLDNYTTYYWRINEVGPFGITEGDVLSFKTGAWLGSGVEGDPFLIQNATDLLKVSIDPNVASAHFELSADIDMDQLPSGIYEPFGFRGVLDGKGHSIFNFHHSENGNEVGFFSIISGIVRNVTLINPFVDGGSGDKVGALAGSLSRSANIDNCHIESAVVSGNNYVGGLAGYSGDYGMYDKWAATVSNCSSSGVVTGSDYVGGISGVGRATNTHSSCIVLGTNYIGGLIGYGVSTVSNCRAEGAVDGNDYVGGLIGRTFDFDSPITSVKNSCAIGNVTGQTMVGGLIGYQPERISNCFARGDVYGVTNVGGLCGWCARLMLNCYSIGEVTGTTDAGGLVGGSASPPYFNCFWDIETSEQTSSAAGRGKTTVLMKSEITYAGFGCDEVWTIDDGNDYPHLAMENKPGQLITKPTYGGGSGEPNDPYLIYTSEQMSIIGLVLCDYDKHFKLMADIDMSYYDGMDGRPNHNIPGAAYMEGGTGRYQPFSGVFDGCHHTISNLKLNGTGEKCVGCFGYIGEGDYTEVKNLGLLAPNIIDTSWKDDKAVGSLAGWLRYGKISNCYVSGGSINVTTPSPYTQDAQVGGLVGNNGYNGNIIRSFSSCSVSGSGQFCFVGGLAGYNFRTAEILDCYSNSSVEGYYGKTGGLVGENYEATIRNCYSTGPVRHGSKPGKGLVGSNSGYFHAGIIEHSFWDVQTSGCSYSSGGTGLSTTSMQKPSTFLAAGWDFISESNNGVEDVWRLCNQGADYPQLHWRFAEGDIVCPDGVDARDLSTLCEQWLLEKLTCEVDLQRDRGIDFLYWSIFAAAWQSIPSSTNWNPKCDIAPEAGDERVDIKDMAAFIEQWLKTGSYYLNADIAPVPNGDNIVNMFDFAVFAENWLVGVE